MLIFELDDEQDVGIGLVFGKTDCLDLGKERA